MNKRERELEEGTKKQGAGFAEGSSLQEVQGVVGVGIWASQAWHSLEAHTELCHE